jgi:RNA-directed DNA polymerase
MLIDRAFLRPLATVLLTGAWSMPDVLERLRQALGRRGGAAWVAKLTGRVFEVFADPPPPRQRQLEQFLQSDRCMQGIFARWRSSPELSLAGLPRPVMTPSPRLPGTWALPPLTTPGALAEWLRIDSRELDWLADVHGLERRAASERLRHYRYRWIRKQGGSARLLEAPKERIKSIQHRLLHGILDHIPPHDASHGFRRCRNVVSYAAPHAGRHVLVRVDLRDFFPSIRGSRVQALFRTAGYPESVARILTGLCTNSVPRHVVLAAPDRLELEDRERLQRVLFASHLPQGAPTSPALANLCAWKLDCRLDGLARSAGATYTRYADDLLFSGGRSLFWHLASFRVLALAIALDEGFFVRNRKTRVMTRANRQLAAGVVVNRHPNVPREEYDLLKAILHNCVRYGPSTQNRLGHATFHAHLRGRIAWVSSINPLRAQRLERLFQQIDWNS